MYAALAAADVAATRPAQGVPAVGEFLRFSARDSDALEQHFREDEEGLLRAWWREYAESSSVGPGQGAARRGSPVPSSASTPALTSAQRSPLPSVSSRGSSHASSPRKGGRGEQGRARAKDAWARRPAGPGSGEAPALGPAVPPGAAALAAAAARAQAVRERELQSAQAQQPLPEAASAPHALRTARADVRERGDSGLAAAEADNDEGVAPRGGGREAVGEDMGEDGDGGQEGEESVGVPVKGGLYEVTEPPLPPPAPSSIGVPLGYPCCVG